MAEMTKGKANQRSIGREETDSYNLATVRSYARGQDETNSGCGSVLFVDLFRGSSGRNPSHVAIQFATGDGSSSGGVRRRMGLV